MAEPNGKIASPSLREALDAMRRGRPSDAQVARLSDLSREEARGVAAAWSTIPETSRVEIVRRFDEISEERLDVNFRRVLGIALDDPSPVVRQLAIAGLWEDESSAHMARLESFVHDDPSPDVRAEAARGLERFAVRSAEGELSGDDAERLKALLLHAATNDAAPLGLQRKAIESLGPLAADAVVAATIADAFNSGEHELQCSALYAMGRSQQARWLPTILQEIEADDAEVRFEAARAAGAIGNGDALPQLLTAARDEDVEVRHAAIAAIGQIGGRAAVRALERLTEDAGDADLELIESTIDDVNTLLDPFQST